MSKKFRVKETGVELVETDFGNFRPPNKGLLLAKDIEALGLTLEPVEEEKPVKKKLYAYIYGNGWIGYRSDNSLEKRSYYIAAPEYDIDFPIGESKMGEVK